MSGRTFTYQGNFDDFVRYLLPDVEMSDRRKSVGIGDSMLREVEEFLNRFVVTAVNDAGDIIFDAAGSYTFQGDVIIGGELQSSNWVDDTVGWQLRSNGTFEFNSSGDVRGDLGVHGDMTMFTGGAMKTNASGLRAEISEATTSTSIVGGSADFAGVDLFTGDAGELEPGLLGVSNSAAGYSTVVLAGADLAGAAQRSYVYFSSTTAGNTETRLSDPSRTYLTAGSSSVDINQTGTEIRVADGDLDIVVKNLPSGSYQDEINFAEDLFKVTLSNAERMRLDTTGLGIGTNAPAVPLHVASSDPEMLRLQLNDTSVAGGYIGFHHNSGRIGYIGFPDNDDLHIKNEDSNGLIYFSTNNLTRMAIEAGGQVGIGTSTPSAQLHVNAGTVNNVATFESTDGGAIISVMDNSTTGSAYVGIRADGDQLSLRAGNSNRVQIVSTGQTRFTDGSISTLGTSFLSDTDTGTYLHSTDMFGVAAGGNPTIVGTSTGVAINNSTASTSGTRCNLVTASVGGVSMLALRKHTSLRQHKSDIVDFDLTDEQFMAIKPRSFIWNGQYIGPNGEFGTTTGDDVDNIIPEGSHLMRRSGFIVEELAEVDLHLVGDDAVDFDGVTAALVAQVQKLQRRIDSLESAHT